MIPVIQMLNRIKYDPAFGTGTFELGYFDRISRKVIRVSLTEWDLNRDSGIVTTRDSTGIQFSFPSHRIRQIFHNGALIWSRDKTQ